jgi:hypothetical protein
MVIQPILSQITFFRFQIFFRRVRMEIHFLCDKNLVRFPFTDTISLCVLWVAFEMIRIFVLVAISNSMFFRIIHFVVGPGRFSLGFRLAF